MVVHQTVGMAQPVKAVNDLCRIIYKMLKEERQYEIRSTEGG